VKDSLDISDLVEKILAIKNKFQADPFIPLLYAFENQTKQTLEELFHQERQK